MADEPSFEPRLRGLDVKLQSEAALPPLERLVGTHVRRGQQARALRQVERVAVPMKDVRRFLVERREAGPPPLVGESERLPAELFSPVRKDAASEGPSDQLSPKADPERRQPGGEPLLEQVDLVDQERIGFLLVGADRSAENHQEVGAPGRDPIDLARPRIEYLDTIAASPENGLEDTEILESDVADRDGGLRAHRRGAKNTEATALAIVLRGFFRHTRVGIIAGHGMVTAPRIEGTCEPRFEAVRAAFAGNFEKHGEIGAAVAIAIDGRVVVDLWGGHADAERNVPWERDTLVNVFSVGKAFTALAALLLVDRGRLDLDLPVGRYWPGFEANGKGSITTRQVLCHQAGLPSVRSPLAPDAMLRWEVMTRALAAERPWWPPGRRHGYHVNTFGFLVGEVVRRISGRTLGAFLRDEISAPLGADFHIGLASHDEPRVAEFVWPPEMERVPSAGAAKLSSEQQMIRNTYFNPPGLSGHGTVNTPPWRRAEIPSTNGHATARGVARIYSALAAGGALEGIDLVSRRVLAEAVAEHAQGTDAVLNRPSRFGLGFQLPQAERPLGPNPEAFGHFGAGGSLGFADPRAGVAFGYVMNRMGPRFQSPTNRDLVEALYSRL